MPRQVESASEIHTHPRRLRSARDTPATARSAGHDSDSATEGQAMTVPYDRIRSRVDLSSIPCALCNEVTVMAVIDHCHVHGMTRGVICTGCNSRMARVDADLTHATPHELFYRDNCPGCRAAGFAGVAQKIDHRALSRPRRASRPTITPSLATDLTSDIAVLDAHYPRHWPRLKRAEAVHRVDAVLSDRTAPHVAMLLAAKGIAVEPDNVRTIRYLARKARRQQPQVNSTSEIHQSRPAGSSATSADAEFAPPPASEIQSEIPADPNPPRSPR